MDDPKTKPPDKSPDKPDKTDKHSKDELLLMMERVDRDISALESQISSLEKKQVLYYNTFTFTFVYSLYIRPTSDSSGSKCIVHRFP